MHFTAPPTDDQIVAHVERWVDLLVEKNYAAAIALVKHDPYYSWTPQLLEAVIEGYGLPEAHPGGVVFGVTSRADASGGKQVWSITRENLPAGVLAEVEYALPLNGSWSDLTATFKVVKAGAGGNLCLEEVHVF